MQLELLKHYNQILSQYLGELQQVIKSNVDNKILIQQYMHQKLLNILKVLLLVQMVLEIEFMENIFLQCIVDLVGIQIHQVTMCKLQPLHNNQHNFIFIYQSKINYAVVNLKNNVQNEILLTSIYYYYRLQIIFAMQSHSLFIVMIL